AVSRPSDPHEHEAERVAALGTGKVHGAKAPMIQRAPSRAEPEPFVDPIHPEDDAASPGRPLDPRARALFESRFGEDFGAVRIHDDTHAAASARAMSAHAYTTGSHIVFAEGKYAPGSVEGEKLLAHELTHVVQQRGAEAPSLSRSAGRRP